MSGTIESQLRYHAKHPDTPPPLRGLMLRAVEELRYRAMVIEQRNAEIKRGHDDFVQAITDPENQPSQWGTVTLALAQQGAQQPVVKEVVVHADYRAMWQEVTRQNQQLCAALSAAPAPQAQPDWLLKTTQDLANSIRRRCFPEVPQFQVLDDLAGVISQIDNMTCGMERKSAPQAQPVAQPLSDSEIEKLREKTFSTYNPYCPVDSKSMRKAVRAAEAAHGIGEVK